MQRCRECYLAINKTTAFVLTEALHLNGSDVATYAVAMSILSDVIFRVKKNIDELIDLVKH